MTETGDRPLPNPWLRQQPHGRYEPPSPPLPAADGTRICRLSANESPLGPSPLALAAFHDAAGQIGRYPEARAETLRQALARRTGTQPEQIICGAGSSEILGFCISAHAAPGDEIVCSQYSFAMYQVLARMRGVLPVVVPEPELQVQVDGMLAAVTARTRIVFLTNPANPAGSWLDREAVRDLHARLPPRVLLVIDAAYAEYATAGDYDSGHELVRSGNNVLVLHTFSKIHGLAGLRIGWGLGPAGVIASLGSVRSPFNVSVPALAAALAALDDEEHTRRAHEHNAREIRWLYQALAETGLRPCHPGQGNFLLVPFPRADGKDAAAADLFLRGRGFQLRRMEPYGLGHCLRLSVGTTEENRGLVTALREFTEGNRTGRGDGTGAA